MAKLEEKIIEELKLALVYQEPIGDYAQWLMGVSIPSVIEKKNNQWVITARVVVKTSDSEYVDGMDIDFSLQPINSVLPVSAYPNSLKNLNSPTSPIFFVSKLPSVVTSI